MSELISDIFKIIECTICTEVMDDPKELHCEHAFCKACLDNVLMFDKDGGVTISCTICKKETTLEHNQTTNDLQANRYLKNLVSTYNEKRYCLISVMSFVVCLNDTQLA